MLTHAPTGWQVDPDTGEVYAVSGRKAGQRIGFAAHGYRRAVHRGRFWYLHRVVWETAHGRTQPPGTHINHLDGDKANNRAANLELTTPSGNMTHAYANDLRPRRSSSRGERHGMARLTVEQVAAIRATPGGRKGVSNRAMAEEYGVSHVQIGRIRRGANWSSAPR